MRRHSHADQPALITDAPTNPDEEFDRRRKRYAIMMAGRALCVVAAALTYRISLWLAIAFVVGGAVVPWCAVIIANDGPAKKRRPVRRPAPLSSERALPAGSDDRTVDE